MTEAIPSTEIADATGGQKDEETKRAEGREEQSEAEEDQSEAKPEEQPEASTSFVPSLSKEEEARLLKVCPSPANTSTVHEENVTSQRLRKSDVFSRQHDLSY